MIDIICKCGHLESIHALKYLKSIQLTSFNDCYYKMSADQMDYCDCKEYTPDNLSYIERLAKERNLI